MKPTLTQSFTQWVTLLSEYVETAWLENPVNADALRALYRMNQGCYSIHTCANYLATQSKANLIPFVTLPLDVLKYQSPQAVCRGEL